MSSSSSSGSEDEAEQREVADTSSSSSSSSSSAEPERQETEPEQDEDEEDFDMYADLETSVFQRSADPEHKTKDELLSRIQELENIVADLLKERDELRTKTNELSKENKIILRNASSLLRTARDEMTKKNAMMTNLQKSLTAMTRKVTARSSSPTTRTELSGILEQCRLCSEVSSQAITAADIQQLVEAQKLKMAERQQKLTSGVWNKKIHLNNMSIYFKSDQIPFSRLEAVTFPTLQKPKPSEAPATLPVPNLNNGRATSPSATAAQPDSLAKGVNIDERNNTGRPSYKRTSDKAELRTEINSAVSESRSRSSQNVKETNGQDATKKRADRERELFGTPSPRPARSPPSDSRRQNKSKSPPRHSGATLHPGRGKSPQRYNNSRYRPRSPNNNQYADSERRDRRHGHERRKRESGELSRTPSPSNHPRPRSGGQGQDRNRSGHHQYDYNDRHKRNRY